MYDNTSRVLSGVVLGMSLLALVSRIFYLVLKAGRRENKVVELLNSFVISITIAPALVILVFSIPFEALANYLAGYEQSFMLFHAIQTIANRTPENSRSRDWTLFTVSSVGWAALYVTVGIIAEVDAACFTNANVTSCSAGVGTPFISGGSTYVVSKRLGVETTPGSVNNVGSYWTAGNGDTVQGTVVCSDGVHTVNAGGTYTNSYENSNQIAGSYVDAYVPTETCTGMGIGFEVGLSFNEGAPPFVPTIGFTVGAVATYVTTSCPAQKVHVTSGPIYALTRVVTDTLTGYNTVFGAVLRPSYSICNIDSFECTPITGNNGDYDAYIGLNGVVSTSPNGADVWIHWSDISDTIQMGQLICDDHASCWDAALSASSCPGVSQWETIQHFTDKPNWNYSLPYEAYSTNFMQNEMSLITARCQQTDAGLTVTGAGGQPLYYSLHNQGDKQCQPEGMAGVALIQQGSCSYPTNGNALVECAGLPSGHYDMVSLSHSQTAQNCTTTSTHNDAFCSCSTTTCGTFCSCPAGQDIIPGSQTSFSDLVPTTGLCNVSITNISDGNLTLVITGSPCFVAGAFNTEVTKDGTYKWRSSVQGWITMYGNNTQFAVLMNWTNKAAPTHYKWETNTTPGTVPSWHINPDPCQWDCYGEIICSICREKETNWCKHSKGNIAFGSSCSGSFFPRGLELWLLYVITYGGLITLVCLILGAIYKRYRKG